VRELSLPIEHIGVVSKPQQGVFSYIAYNQHIEALLSDLYGRSNLCLKIFKHLPNPDCLWDKTSLTDCTVIQNLLAIESLAPRVYDIIKVNNFCAQVTDYLTGEGDYQPSLVKVARRKYGLATSWDMNPKNWVAGKLVDFQSWYFNDRNAYIANLIDRAYVYAAWGSRPEPYQSIESAPSQRSTAHRIKALQWQSFDFSGKDILDLGCNLGVMGMEASRLGARRVVGVDQPHVADIAREYANWSQFWNLDFLGLHLPQQRSEIHPLCGLGQFDVVFALSVDRQIGYKPWIADLCRAVLFLEGHVPDSEVTYRDSLEQDFSRVEFLGMSRDHGPRPIFRCWK
jgi:hypothetical protein